MNATLDWFGCATFRLRVGRTVIFLDAYLDRVPGSDGPVTTPEEVESADWIVVGHSHFDHLWGAERIALNTGAILVGSYETTRIMANCGVPESQLMPVAGGERVHLAENLYVRVLPSLHSCTWSGLTFLQPDVNCVGDLRIAHQERKQRSQDLWSKLARENDDIAAHVKSGHQGARGDGGALAFLFEIGEQTLFYQDTSGCWSGIVKDLRPDVAIVAAAGRGNIDGEPIQGSLTDFVVAETQLLDPGRVILAHHDNWLPGFSISTDTGVLRRALANLSPAVPLRALGYAEGRALFS